MELRWIGPDGVTRRELTEIGELLQRTDGFCWLDIPVWSDEAERLLAAEFGFHQLALQDCRDRNHIPRVHVYPDHLFIVGHAPEIGIGGHVHYLELDQFIAERYLVTVHGPLSPKVPLEAALRETSALAERLEKGRLAPTSPFSLTYAIVSSIARRESALVAEIARQVGLLEQRVMAATDEEPQEFLTELFTARHELLTIKTMASQGADIYGRAIKLTTFAPNEGLKLMKDLLDQYKRVASIAHAQLEFLMGVTEFFRARTDTKMTVAAERNYGTIPLMEVASVEAEPVLDGPRALHITFNKSVGDLKGDAWARFISVEPKPAELKWESSARQVTLRGNFEPNTPYKVKILAGAPAQDQTSVTAAFEKDVRFSPHPAHLSLPSFEAAQWLGGRGVFEFSTANLKSVLVQVKRISPDRAVDALRGYRVYEHDESNEENIDNTRIPYAVISGKTVWQKAFPSKVELDHSERIQFTWDEVGGGKRLPGMYFVSAEGNPKEGVVEASAENSDSEEGSEEESAASNEEEPTPAKRRGSQTLVQVTDIGLAWKFSGSEAMIYAFSHTTGKPLPGVSLQSFTDESEPVDKQISAADGTARMKMDTTKWLVAQKENDFHGIAFHKEMPELNMWAFDLPYTEHSPDKPWKEMLIFTERPVYQPGETVYFKAIQRMRSPDGLSMSPAGEAAKLRLYDPRHRLVTERDVKFSDTGTLADTLRMPGQGLGWYRMKISFPPPAGEQKPAQPAEGEEEGDGGYNREVAFEQQILVQEYQPNSFRIDFASKDVQREGDTLKVPLNAAYLMGKPLSDAEVKWTSRISQAPFAPAKWDSYRFCNARSYYVWDGQEYHSMDEERWQAPLLTGQGTLKLSAKGETVIEAKAPASFGVPGPKVVSVQAEVTDINQQTIASSWSRTEDSSQFYLGAKRGPNAVRVGEEITMDVAAVKPDGTRFDQPVQVTALVEHLAWNAVRVETAGGGSSVRNNLVFAKVSEHNVAVSPNGGVLTFKPAVAGTHNITFTAKDAKGAEARTVVSIDVFGAGDLSWQQKDGVKIDLVPDKESYKPGEVAKVVVKTPLKGTALVTVEQNKVLWQKLETLQPGGVVEIPLDEKWAPNVFVCVTHIRGGADDPRDIKSPEYRVGFCQLRIESKRHALALDIKPSKPEYRPGETVEVEILSKDSAGKPLPNTEVAFWAVDQGILSLMPWEAPDIVQTFHYDQSLFVHTGLSLVTLMKENPKELDFVNKGFVIGGGGSEEGSVNLGMRRNFKPTAYWHGTLKTGEGGAVKVSFPAPDNLTEFHLVAVANEGVDRFGTAESKFKVNKPLMLEPALPRFANAGDQITLKAVVHNTTEKQTDVKVSLTIDDHCALLSGLNGEAIEGKSQTQTISLAPQGTRAALFTVKFATDGPTVMKWKADGGTPQLADAVESNLEIGLPGPVLREVNFLSLTSADDGKNLLAGVRPEVLEGKGEVTITLSNSRVLEGAEAVEQLLRYPYGCAEQTMSSMLPWLALRDLKKALPSINRPDEEITTAIQKGVDRLLSMQTNNGGLAYWPGQQKVDPWASAHGAVGLILASRVGAEVPQARVDALLKWLSGSLREAAKDTRAVQLSERAYAAWALALAGKPEPAYHEVLFRQRNELTSYTRAMLALAITEASGPADMSHALLSMKNEEDAGNWFGGECTGAIRALALMKLKDPSADAEMGRLMASRNPRGDWRNTFNNAWVLLALSREAASMPPPKAGQPCVLTLDGKPQEIALPGEPAAKATSFARAAGTALPQLTAKVPQGAKFFARVEVSGRSPAAPQPARNAGFSIDRTWQKVATDGTLSPANQLKTGDLVLVSLNVNVPAPAEYLVIDDPLPATMEGVNPNFNSMVAGDRQAVAPSWIYDHSEMHRDRMLFFRDHFEGKGNFRLRYLARVVAAGDVLAPPARIEMMYDPARFGLSPAQRITTKASADEEVVVK